MSQHDYDLANQSGASFRADLNNALLAVVSNNAGATAPSPTFAQMWWADTSTDLLKQRNSANSAWIAKGTLSAINWGFLPAAGGALTGALTIAEGAAVASAATLTPGADGNYFHVTGTTGMNAIANTAPSPCFLEYDGVVVITHSSTLKCPANLTYTTKAGDVLVWVYDGASVWKCVAALNPNMRASANQAAVTLGNTDGEIGTLAIGAGYSQAEVTALRDKAEELADDVRNLSVLLHQIRTDAISVGWIKGSA